MHNQRPRLVIWFSCGDASAVTVKLAQKRYADTHDIAIARCVLIDEHSDNDRFAADCEKWFGQPVLNLRSEEFPDCEAVWAKRRYMSGVAGAPCTIEMKKAVRWAFETAWQPDLQAFGYTVEERLRAERFRQQNPEVNLITPLIDEGLTKADCHRMVEAAGIIIPMMYRLGFANNNCFSGDTEFLTDLGTRKLADAVGESVRVRGAGGGWTDATIQSFGDQPLMRLTLRRNNVSREIYATAKHRWFVSKREVLTDELVEGQQLASPLRDPHPWTVVSIEPTDRVEEVFCAVVPDGQAFTLAGNILTGNCIGCVKASSPTYWNRIRRLFPEVFAARARLSREIGCRLVRQTKGDRPRLFLDELDPHEGDHAVEPPIDCSLLCQDIISFETND